MKIKFMVWIFLFALLFPAFVQASGPVGAIMYVDGAVEIVRSGKTIPAQQGVEVLIRDGLRTGKEAYAAIRFSDGSTLTMAPATEITVADYTIGEERQNSIIEMTTGFIHSRIRKMGAGFFGIKKNRWEVHTQTAVVGVRGTDIMVLVEPGMVAFGEAPTECLVRDGQAYGFPAGIPDELLDIPAGKSFKAPSAGKPGSVGAPSEGMQNKEKELVDLQTKMINLKHPSPPPLAKDVTIDEQDFEACDREIEKAEKAIAEWEAYAAYWQSYTVVSALGVFLTPNAHDYFECEDSIDREAGSRRGVERWKEKLRQLRAIKRKMQKPKESSGGDGGGNGGHSTNQYEHRDFTGEQPGRVVITMQTDTDWHSSHG